MKPLLINTYDKGGAANSCIRLHQGLLSENISSKVLLKYRSNPNIQETYSFINVLENKFQKKITRKTLRILQELKLYYPKPDSFINSRSRELELFSYPFSEIDLTKSDLYKNADLINLHWAANFIDYKSFFKKNKKPVVWTLHDQNPFTGGEHYTEDYLGIDEKGYPIKRVVSKREQNKFNEIIKLKKESLSNIKNLHIVTPSLWLTEEVEKSEVFNKFNVKTIPYGMNTSVFQPRDKIYSKELLGLPQDKQIILFVADSISNNRKGYVYLKRAFEQLNNKDVVLCSIGAKSASLITINNIIELGTISNERLMSVVYSAADAFIIPSLMDNLPNTVLESLLCGTPVIGFPIGGIPDMIQDGLFINFRIVLCKAVTLTSEVKYPFSPS